MKMIMVHVLLQCVGHGAVAFISVHDCRKDVLLIADNFNCGFVRIGVELLGKLIAAVVEKVGGVDTSGQWHKITPSQELSDLLIKELETASPCNED